MTTFNVNALLAEAEAAFRRGDMAAAERRLSDLLRLAPAQPRPWHLFALVAERNGRPADALAAFQRAISLGPRDAGLWLDLAERLADVDHDAALDAYTRALGYAPRSVSAYLGRARLLHRLGRAEQARADLLRVYQLEPQRLDGWLARGALEIDAGIPASAVIAYDRALAIAPSHLPAAIGRARAALEMGDTSDALARFEALAATSPDDRGIAMGEAEAREFAGRDRPHRRLAEVVGRHPDWAEGQALLARMAWEDGTEEFDRPLRAAIEQTPHDTALHDALITALAGVDRHEQAADAAADAARLTGERRFVLEEAAQAGGGGDLDRATALFATLPADMPGSTLHRTRHEIRLGNLDCAESLASSVIASEPDAVAAWALIDLLWRARGDDRATWLHGQNGLIRQHQLALDAESIASIVDCLRGLHHRRRHPIGQSMRGGTQTRGRLFSRPDAPLRQLLTAIGETVQAHWRALPARDERHPLLRHRDRTPALSGSWSVRLTAGGHHVPHVHPHGLLSSASYWLVPPADGVHDTGWLEVGRPPADLMLDVAPIARFEPEPGTLVLFPSTAFHGTTSFPAGERITAAFDISAL